MLQDYLYDQAAVEPARQRILALMDYLTKHINKSKSGYLIGDNLTSADIYYAYISNVIRPQPHELNPMPQGLRTSYQLVEKLFGKVPSVLIDFRDRIFEKHLELPVNF